MELTFVWQKRDLLFFFSYVDDDRPEIIFYECLITIFID